MFYNYTDHFCALPRPLFFCSDHGLFPAKGHACCLVTHLLMNASATIYYASGHGPNEQAVSYVFYPGQGRHKGAELTRLWRPCAKEVYNDLFSGDQQHSLK